MKGYVRRFITAVTLSDTLLGGMCPSVFNLCRMKCLAPDVGNCTTVELLYKNTIGTPQS